MKISKNFNLASSLGCILHVNFQIIKISISWYLQVVLTLKLNQRYLIKQFIECHNFELVIQTMCVLQTEIGVVYRLVCKV